MRIENLWCEDCGIVHFVQVMQRDNKGRVVKTKCHGKDFLPLEGKPTINDGRYYVKHRQRGYDIKMIAKRQPRKTKLPTTFKREHKSPVPVQPAANRKCLVELSVSFRGQFLTVKVFEDATPEKFYEFFDQVGEKPIMIKPRNFGKENPVHIMDIPYMFKMDGNSKPTYHNLNGYEKLLTENPGSTESILEKNMRIVSAIGKS